MRCRGGTDTRLIHCTHGQMRKRCAIWTAAVLGNFFWGVGLWPPSHQGGQSPSLHPHIRTNSGSWIEGLFFVIFFPPPMSKQDWCYVFKLFFWGLPACCQEDLCQTNIYLGQRRRCWYRMYGLSKGCYCFWEAKEGFNVCVRACMRIRQLTQIRHTGFQ